jgi:hypothetical protein
LASRRSTQALRAKRAHSFLEIAQGKNHRFSLREFPDGEVSSHGDFPSASRRRKDMLAETKNLLSFGHSVALISAILRGVQKAIAAIFPSAFRAFVEPALHRRRCHAFERPHQ